MAKPDVLEREEWDLWDLWMRAQRLLMQHVDRSLQREFGLSKAEFSMLVTLLRSSETKMRIAVVTASLGWEKSRVSHLLTRMERRGFLERTDGGTTGRRIAIGLTSEGLRLAEAAVAGHALTVRRDFHALLSVEQAQAIRAWSEQTIARLEP